MKLPYLIPFIVVIVAISVSLVFVILHPIGEMDFPSYAIATAAYYVTPETMPLNDTSDAIRLRTMMEEFSVAGVSPSIASIPFIDISTNIYDQSISNSRNRRHYIRIMKPRSIRESQSHINMEDKDTLKDVIVFFFPGAWAIGSVNASHEQCAKLAESDDFLVMCPDYRQAPEDVYPAAFDDAWRSVEWVHKHSMEYGGNPDRIFVAGESAGGNLAAAVASHNLDVDKVTVDQRLPILGLLLVYPPLAYNFTTQSYTRFWATSGTLKGSVMRWTWNLYGGGLERAQLLGRESYTFAPMLTPAAILLQYPPTVVMVAQTDVLRDDGISFVDLLRAHNVAGVELVVYNSSVHGFFGKSIFPDGDRSVVTACDKLARIAAYA